MLGRPASPRRYATCNGMLCNRAFRTRAPSHNLHTHPLAPSPATYCRATMCYHEEEFSNPTPSMNTFSFKNARMEATMRTTSCAMSYGWGMGVLQFRLTPMNVSIEQRPWTTKEEQLQKNSVSMSGPISRTDFAVRLPVSAVLAQSERVRELIGSTKPPQATCIGRQRRCGALLLNRASFLLKMFLWKHPN